MFFIVIFILFAALSKPAYESDKNSYGLYPITSHYLDDAGKCCFQTNDYGLVCSTVRSHLGCAISSDAYKKASFTTKACPSGYSAITSSLNDANAPLGRSCLILRSRQRLFPIYQRGVTLADTLFISTIMRQGARLVHYCARVTAFGELSVAIQGWRGGSPRRMRAATTATAAGNMAVATSARMAVASSAFQPSAPNRMESGRASSMSQSALAA